MVEFVRRRDPRVQARKLELKNSAAQKAHRRSQRRARVLLEEMEKAAEYKEQNSKELKEYQEEILKIEQEITDENR